MLQTQAAFHSLPLIFFLPFNILTFTYLGVYLLGQMIRFYSCDDAKPFICNIITKSLAICVHW